MKSFQLFAAGLLAASSLASAFAADLGTVYVTGSSAFRVSTVQGLSALFVPSSLQVGSVGTLSGSTYAIFKGTLNSTGDTVVICTSFSGSAAGLQAIVQTTSGGTSAGAPNVPVVTFINPSTALAPAPSSTTALTIPGTPYTHSADIAMSDVRAELTPFTRATDLVALEAAGSPVGVIPFYWLKNNGAPAAISNLTHQMVKAAATDSLRLSFFTKNDADVLKVRIVGRNPDSGTRLTAFQESGFGALSIAKQFKPTDTTTTTAGSGTIPGLELWPAEAVLGINFAQGESGYSSGGTLRDVLKRPSGAGVSPIISYLGLSDTLNAVGAATPAAILSYNGVTPETAGAFDSFVNGTYPFWSYEHLYYSEAAGDAVIQIGDELSSEIQANQATASGISLAAMKVKRASEGAVIIHK